MNIPTPSSCRGRLFLVSIGPGNAHHMTPAARVAIAAADVVIGYVTYLRLVADLLDGKEVIKKGMTEEIDRAVEAIRHARAGRTVALISSGDVGIYGMAGPTFEALFAAGWRPDQEGEIDVEVIPGITALAAAAALVGAPLTHDFCAISLSDLLTPWPVIARRLAAAAAADFVIALYNPKSGRRTQQIVEAQWLLMQHRAPETPVAIVKSAFRTRQHVELTTLAKMAECEIGMLSTVLVGNSTTFVAHGKMVTPRGYHHKYDADGSVRDGERPAQSLSAGLAGFIAEVQNALQPVAELAARYQLPAAYLERLRTLSPSLWGAPAPSGSADDSE